MPYKKLVLFDIDGTMLKTDKGAREALSGAIKSVTDNEINLSVEDCAGNTDFLIISKALENSGHNSNNGKIKQVLKKYLILLEKLYNHENSRLYSGIVELLQILDNDKSILLGLLTGNIRKGAEIKLKSFNILNMFKIGAFGDDGFFRKELPGVAVKKAGKLTGLFFTGKNVVIIGDTASDVECGKIIGAKTIAVCRKKEFLSKIEASKPDYLFFDTEDYRAVLHAIYS